jgi:hypothetical protein
MTATTPSSHRLSFRIGRYSLIGTYFVAGQLMLVNSASSPQQGHGAFALPPSLDE